MVRAMNGPLLSVSGMGKRFGGFVALSDVNLEIVEGERLGLIGPNGSGKSTFVNCLCGTPFPTLTLLENIRVPILYAAEVKNGRGAADPRRRCEELLDMVGLLSKADSKPADLTQIEMRKLELARAMASEPRLLVADEAMAGLSHQEVDDILMLFMKLNGQGVTIIMIEHIMRAVLAFSQRLVVLVAGRKIADGDPRDVIRRPDVVAAYLGS